MNLANNIYLIGFMGTGKTVVGKKVAEIMGRFFLDIDVEIEKVFKCAISEIFDKYGEKEFRKKESDMLGSITGRSNLVVSTGGGIVLNIENLEKMKKSGLVVTLIARPEIICERLREDTSRPLLACHDEKEKLEEIKRLLFMRAGLYIKGDYIIDTSDLDSDIVAQKIIDYYNEWKTNS